MHEHALLLTLAAGLSAALLLGLLTQRLGLSSLVGYLLAGLLVGPHTPGFVADVHLAEQLANFGVVLLMFGVGLHFQVEDLAAVRRVVVPGALAQCLCATTLGAVGAHALGWPWTAGLVFGLSLSVASTVVLTRVLADADDLHTLAGRNAVGWLVVEDLFTVVVLVLLPALFGPQAEGGWAAAWALAAALVKLGALAVVAWLFGGRAVRGLLRMVEATHSRELFTLTVLVIALAIAVASALWFGVSIALGALLAGMIAGRTEFGHRASSEALPLRDAFAVLFFVSVGMLLDPGALLGQLPMLAAALAVILVGKPVAALALLGLRGAGGGVSVRTALALAQIGEFSFIVVALGAKLGLVEAGATNVLVAAAIVSITLNPVYYRLAGPLERRLRAMPRVWAWMGRSAQEEAPRPERYRAVLVGFGPTGERLHDLLERNGFDVVVVERNAATVARLREAGFAVVEGDAAEAGVLEAAGLEAAVALVLSAPAGAEMEAVIRGAREKRPALHVMARSSFLAEAPGLREAGASVFTGEGEVALAMTVHLMKHLGATPDQIDREMDEARAALDAAGV